MPKITYGTEMFCENHKIEWSCIDKKIILLDTYIIKITKDSDFDRVIENVSKINGVKFEKKIFEVGDTKMFTVEIKDSLLVKEVEKIKGVEYVERNQEGNYLTTVNSKVQPIVGGDRDENGCIGSAGYVWSKDKNKCIRPWEIDKEEKSFIYGKIIKIEEGRDGEQITIEDTKGTKFKTVVGSNDLINSENIKGIYGSNTGLYLGNNIIIYYTKTLKEYPTLLIGDEIKIVSVGLSENDENFLKNLREDRINKNIVSKLDKILQKYKIKLSKYKNSKAVSINNKLITKIENKVSYLLDKYPQDIALPKKANDMYLKLELLKLELTNIDFFNEEKISCELNNNKWKKVGKAQMFDCIIEYSDFGNKCNSSDECKGNCLVRKVNGSGFCSTSNNVFGCKNTIENVKAGEGILCID